MEFEVDGILYDVNEDGKSVTVKKYTKKKYTNNVVSCSESVTIPFKVTFDGMTYDVTSIGEEAFSRCSGLTSLKVEEGNPKYDSRNNCNAIIESSTNTLIAGCKYTTIPNSVTSIGEYNQEIKGETNVEIIPVIA